MKLTLVVLAAGMGSRYGGLKQLDEVGPHGETVMDYSIFDAMRAGFTRVVFVIRRDIEAAFRQSIGSKYDKLIEVDYAFQRLDDLPCGFTVPAGREKPWGTGQALYAARELLEGPFAVINADDFYGRDSYQQIAGCLTKLSGANAVKGCICGFTLSNTLSENGSVSRGICSASKDNFLQKVVENTKIYRFEGKIVSEIDANTKVELTGDELVSMNSWGFLPGIMPEIERLFVEFLKARGTELKSEFYLPGIVDTLINSGKAEITVLRSRDSWFGITYREDKEFVQSSIRALIAKGAYPGQLYHK